jgi:hypothetical protein
MMRTLAITLFASALGACSSIPSLDDVGNFIGLTSNAQDSIAAHEECAALDMAIAANLSSSTQAREEEQQYADAFRNQSGSNLDKAVKLRMADEGSDRATAFRTSSGIVRKLTRDKAVYMNDRLLAEDTGVLDNEWVNGERLDCQEALSS